MAMQPKRKSPDTGQTRGAARGRKPAPSRAKRLLLASGALIARHPRALGGVVVFGVVFSFIATNAMWYQPRPHPAPFLATRAAADQKQVAGNREPSEPGVTVFRIERESEAKPAEKPTPSELVRRVQAGLAARNAYDGPIDGLAGPKTEAAIAFFEQSEGMQETGQANKAVLDRLAALAAADKSDAEIQTASTRPQPREDDVAALIQASENAALPAVAIPAPRPVSPALVMKIQNGLAGMGYNNVKVDGIPGDTTRTAIRAFEKSYRLPVTGEPSEVVLKKLKAIGAI
jgi:peptidoglycan hydrolase-like protein with peptidoglycan-binding domain